MALLCFIVSCTSSLAAPLSEIPVARHTALTEVQSGTLESQVPDDVENEIFVNLTEAVV